MMEQEEKKNQSSVLAGEKAQVDYTLIYFLSFLFLGALTSVLFSSLLLAFNVAPSFGNLIKVVIACLIFFIFLTIQPILIKSRWLNILLVFIFSLLLISMHFRFYSNWLIVGGLIFLLSYIIGLTKGRRKLDESLHIIFRSYARSYLIPVLIGFSLLISFLYAGLYSNAGRIPYPAYKVTVSVAMPFIQGVVPGFKEETKVDEFFALFVKKTLKPKPGVIELIDMDKSLIAQKAGLQLKDEFAQFTGLPVIGEESMINYFHRVANRYLITLNRSQYAFFVPLALFFLLFYIFRLFFAVAKEAIMVIAGIIYHLLQAFGLFTIRTETRQKEVIVVR